MVNAHPSRPSRRGPVSRAAAACALGAIRFYQLTLGHFLGGRCRFYPSCSCYAAEAYRTHPPIKASWLTIRRLARCHPLGGHGVDLVPPRED